jgi:hypothetical protein
MKTEMQELKEKALKLLEPFDQKYSATLSNVHWVEQDGHSIDGDFCEKCIGKAVKNARKLHKEERQKVLSKFNEIKETGKYNGKKVTNSEVKKAKQYELKQLGLPKFRSTYNYGGGYENDCFLNCEICDKGLNISILINEQELSNVLEDLEDGKIDDQTGYRAYCLIYNSSDEEEENYYEIQELTIKLARIVIEILSVVSH